MHLDKKDNRLIELEKKWLTGKITHEEAREYADWYNAGQDDPLSIPGSFARNREELRIRMLDKINANREWQATIISIRGKFIRHIAAAAITLFVIGGSTYLFTRHAAKKELVSGNLPVHPKELPYGGDKAILTLANGKQVILDSTAKGTISMQGSTKIINLEKGKLAYQAGSANNKEIIYNTLTTPRGGQYQLILADGTHVWLNSASSLKFPTGFGAINREVELQGEGYFEVAKNAAHPFIVKANKMQVEVLGTHFNVMAYTDEKAINTTLVEGAVKVVNETSSGLLKPGQQASLAKNAAEFAISPADMEEALAWKEGKFWFKKTDIKTIMRQIARWYDVNITYADNSFDVELSGVFPRKENVSQLLEVLEDAGNVHFSIEGNNITVMSSEKK